MTRSLPNLWKPMSWSLPEMSFTVTRVKGVASPWHPTSLSRRDTSLITHTPNLPTKIIPTKSPRLKISRKFPIDMRIPPLKTKIMLESSPLKS